MMGGNQNQAQPPSKQLGINSSSGATNEQANPLTYLAGKRRFAGTFITDAFDQRAETQGGGGKDSGKGGGGSGTNYYASFAVAFCLGPVAGFHDLFMNGDAVFTDNTPLNPVSLTESGNVATFQTANAHGLTTGQSVVITGADQPEFNGEFVITVVSTKQFQYTIPGTTLSAETATGQIFCWVKLNSIYRGAEDSVTVTIPNYGTMTLYWGTETQPADAYLPVSGTTHSPMRGVCYAVFKQFFLGLNQTNIQNIEIVLSRCPSPVWLTSGTHANLSDEANPAAVFYDLLTNPRTGLGLTDADFNLPQLAAAASQFHTEGLGVSPLITRADTAQSLIQQLCESVDATVMLDDEGLLTLIPIRAPASYSTSGKPPPVMALDDYQLAELPKPKSADWSNTFNETRIVFPNRDAAWQNDFIEWKDFQAGSAAQKTAQPQTLQRDWITQRTIAAMLVQAAGSAGAVPAQTGTEELIFTTGLWSALSPGTLFKNDFTSTPAARANGYFRVVKRTFADPAQPHFTIEYALDRSYLNVNPTLLTGGKTGGVSPHLVIGGGGGGFTPSVPDLVDIPANSRFGIVELPLALCPSGKPAVAALVARDQQTTVMSQLWLGRNFVFNGTPPDSFFLLATVTKFAFHGALTADFPAATAFASIANALPAEATPIPFPLTEGLAIQLDGVDLILPDVFDFDALTNGLLLFVGNEIMSVAATTLTDSGAYTLTVIRGRFGTTIADHVAGDVVLVIALADLKPLQHPHFLATNTGRFKLTLGAQQVSDVDAFDIVFSGSGW